MSGFLRKDTLSELIHSYKEPLYWHIRKMVIDHDDTKDVLQEVFIRVWRNLDNFRGNTTIFNWLYRIASNESLRFLDKKRRINEQKENIQDILTRELDSSLYISGDIIQMTLQKALLTLTDRQRLVFNMHYFDDLEYSDIAEILETTVNNVKVLYHNAKNQIQAIIRQEL